MNYLQDTFIYDGKSFKNTWIPGVSPEGLEPITQVYGFCFNNDGQLLVQRHDESNWQVMGGSPEDGETFEETLKREVDEEVNIEIGDIVYLGSQKTEGESGQVSYQIRCAARITKMKPRKADPCRGSIRQRRFIDYKDYAKISGWGPVGQAMADSAAEKLGFNK